jgi:hypothetical protein
MGGQSSAPATTTTINKTELPAFIEEGGKANLAYGNEVAANLATPYMGNMVANPFNADTLASMDQVRNSANLAQPGMSTAAGTLADVQNYQAPTVAAQSWLTADQNGYMSPYTQNVVDTTLAQMDKARQKALLTTDDKAYASGAWGGSRQGVMQGQVNSDSIMNQAQLAAQLYNQGYTNAQGMFNTDADRALTADRANQTSNIQAAQLQSQAAMQGAYTAQMAQNAAMQGAAGLQAIGQTKTQYDQDLLNQQAAQYDAMRNYPLEKLGIRESTLSQVPYGTTTTSTSTSTGQKSNNTGALIGAGGQIASALLPLAFLSDARVKKDIVPFGFNDPHSGAPLYSYRYDDEGPNSKKTVGPVAQDLMAMGKPTGEINGVKTIAPEDAVTPTIAALAAKTDAKMARPFGFDKKKKGGVGILTIDVVPTKVSTKIKKVTH